MARTHYSLAIALDECYNDAYCKLGVVYRNQDERQKSLEVLTKALKLEPAEPQVMENLALLNLDE